MNEIGRRLGHCHGVISYHLHKSGLSLRKDRLRYPQITTERLIALYKDGLSTPEIAERVGLTAQSVYLRFVKAGIESRSISKALKLACAKGRMKPGKNIKPDGYHYVITGGYVGIKVNGQVLPEHKVVWERTHGPLPKDWIIHHLNGDRTDNRLANLFAMPRRRHSPKEIIKGHQQRIRQLEEEVKECRSQLQLRLLE